MDAGLLKALALRHGPALLAGMLLGALIVALVRIASPTRGPDPRAIADAALVSLREQGRITVVAARYVAVASASESRLGLEARKTLILPGRVGYGLDLARLRREHMSWDEATRTLSIQLPPLEISGPDIEMEEARETAEGGLMMVLTGVEQTLDERNRREAQQDLLRQARQPQVLQAAREVALRTVARGFALPLRAAGIDASVAVRFVDAAGNDLAVHLDRGRRIEDVTGDRRAGERQNVQ
ncbi:MAG: DUF4230 domain-containing protein [Pseudomonadota bacterium]|nr:DUF4230 domain-containing protein [Pseudomonadota bacterium]